MSFFYHGSFEKSEREREVDSLPDAGMIFFRVRIMLSKNEIPGISEPSKSKYFICTGMILDNSIGQQVKCTYFFPCCSAASEQ